MVVLDVRFWCPDPDPKRAWEGRPRLSGAVVRALGSEGIQKTGRPHSARP